MRSNTVRLNITLPKELVRTLDRITSPGNRSRFIAEALEMRIEQQRKKKLDRLLDESYKAAREESVVLAKEFEDADLEGWDDY